MITGRRDVVIFVFGSNTAGRHGKGAALYARNNRGAVYGVGEGMTGDCYALPTKDKNLKILTLEEIKVNVDRFVEYASMNLDLDFEVTRIGCGLAGYKEEEIAPLFIKAPHNCKLPLGWKDFYIEDLPPKKNSTIRERRDITMFGKTVNCPVTIYNSDSDDPEEILHYNEREEDMYALSSPLYKGKKIVVVKREDFILHEAWKDNEV